MRKWEDIDKHQTVATKEELSIIDTLSFLEVQRIKQNSILAGIKSTPSS